MLNNLLAIVAGDGSSWAGQTQSPSNFYFENKSEAFLYALIGFLVVFVGIIIIIFTIWLVGLIMKKTNNLEFLSKGKKKKEKVVESKSEASQATTTQDDGEIPDEVKAAIIAAIMAYYEEKQEKCEFTVKR
ncbi:MAG: OadG family transporter subunit, partial [Candidatus Coproplasma sp.]